MTDKHQMKIIQTINLYGIAIDARRWDLFNTIFLPGVFLDYSGSLWTSLDTFKSDFIRDHEQFDATQHAMMGHLVDVAGDTASAFTYCSWRLIRKNTEGGDFLEGTAWYDDSFVLTDAGWRISKRICRILWTDGNPRATGAAHAPNWHLLRDDARDGAVGYLTSYYRGQAQEAASRASAASENDD